MHALFFPALFAAGALLAIASPTRTGGEPAASRLVFRTVRAEGGTRRYAAWLPPGFDPAKRWPAIVFLHGSGECGVDGEKPVHIGLGPALLAHPERWSFVAIFPQKPREDEEWEEHETLVYAVLKDAERAFAIDGGRVGLAGVSQGGHGAWMIGARHPERWRCLVAVCGYGRARTVAPRIVRLPVWAFHGLRDDLVDPADTRHIIAELKSAKLAAGLDTASARMTLYPEANHNSWDAAFAEPELSGWLQTQLRGK